MRLFQASDGAPSWRKVIRGIWGRVASGASVVQQGIAAITVLLGWLLISAYVVTLGAAIDAETGA